VLLELCRCGYEWRGLSVAPRLLAPHKLGTRLSCAPLRRGIGAFIHHSRPVQSFADAYSARVVQYPSEQRCSAAATARISPTPNPARAPHSPRVRVRIARRACSSENIAELSSRKSKFTFPPHFQYKTKHNRRPTAASVEADHTILEVRVFKIQAASQNRPIDHKHRRVASIRHIFGINYRLIHRRTHTKFRILSRSSAEFQYSHCIMQQWISILYSIIHVIYYSIIQYRIILFKWENDDIPVRLHTTIKRYSCPELSVRKMLFW